MSPATWIASLSAIAPAFIDAALRGAVVLLLALALAYALRRRTAAARPPRLGRRDRRAARVAALRPLGAAVAARGTRVRCHDVARDTADIGGRRCSAFDHDDNDKVHGRCRAFAAFGTAGARNAN